MIPGPRTRYSALAALLLLAAGVAPDSAARAESERLSSERVILRTGAGDIALALFPEAAPRHVKKLLALVKEGVYDGAHFFKVDPGLVLHLSGINRRRVSLSPKQAKAIRRLRLEPSPIRHRYGIVTVAHDREDPDPSETSLAIMLAEVPSMDGRFTVLGRVVEGFEALEAIRRVPTDSRQRPLRRVEVEQALVMPSPGTSLPRFPLLPASAALLLVGAILLLPERFSRLRRAQPSRRWQRLLSSLALLLILSGFFGVLAALAPAAGSSAWLGPALLAGSVAVFRLMSRFEGECFPAGAFRRYLAPPCRKARRARRVT